MARSKGWSNAARRTARRMSSVLRAMAKAPIRRKAAVSPPAPKLKEEKQDEHPKHS